MSEGALQTMRTIALSRHSAHDTLQQYFRESVGQRITVNTVNVSRRIDSGEFLINPQAGISFQWAKGQAEAYVGGVTWVGYKPHFLLLPEKSLKLTPFMQIQSTIVRLTDQHAKRPSSR